MSKTELYRAYSADGILLYVGISGTALQRLKAHKAHSAWFGGDMVLRIETYDTRAMVMSAERKAIREENPKFNITHARKDGGMSKGKTSGLTLSVTEEDREKINRLCELDGRSRKGEIMWLVEQRLAEIDRKDD